MLSNSLCFSGSPYYIYSFSSLKISRSFSFLFLSFTLPFLPFTSLLLLFISKHSLHAFMKANSGPYLLHVQHTTCLKTLSPCTSTRFFSCLIGSGFLQFIYYNLTSSHTLCGSF